VSDFMALVTKDARVLAMRAGRKVADLSGAPAERVARGLSSSADDDAKQLLLARATGNYKRGNER